MNSDIVAYEAMLAAKDAAEWALWGVIAAFVSAGVTAFATVVALLAIGEWKNQVKLQEVNQLKVSIFRYQVRVGVARERFERGIIDKELSLEKRDVLIFLDDVYTNTFTMHNKKRRNQASSIYCELAEIHTDFINGIIDRESAVDKIVAIRKENKFINTSM